MSEFALVPADMQSASSAAESAADGARGSDGAGALSALAGALPGSTTADTLPDLGSAWTTGVSEWSDQVDDLAASIAKLTAEAEAADQTAGGKLGGLSGVLGGG